MCSHLVDLFVSTSGCTKVNNLDVVSTGLHIVEAHCASVTIIHHWLRHDLLHVFCMIHQERVAIWSDIVMTIGWEKSLCILNAIKNNILNFWVIETIILRFLLSSLEFSWISLNSVFFPVLSPVSIGKFGEVNSPLVKRNPEFSLVGVSETSLLFPLFCPEFTFIRPWTGIMCETPRISHLNEFVDAFSISC